MVVDVGHEANHFHGGTCTKSRLCSRGFSVHRLFGGSWIFIRKRLEVGNNNHPVKIQRPRKIDLHKKINRLMYDHTLEPSNGHF